MSPNQNAVSFPLQTKQLMHLLAQNDSNDTNLLPAGESQLADEQVATAY